LEKTQNKPDNSDTAEYDLINKEQHGYFVCAALLVGDENDKG